MAFNTLALKRYSCRNFDRNKAVDRDIMLAILESARLAPSACNRQPWVFVVIDDLCDASLRSAVIDSYNREWVKSAPAYIIACGNHNEAWHRQADDKDHTDVDLSIAIEHICLAAADHGLGTCWVCNFDVEKITSALNIPSHIEPIAIIPIGYPAEDATIAPKVRKNIDEIVKWGSF